MPLSLYDHRYVLLRQELIQSRKSAKLTQVELAAKLGVGQSLISKVERGDSCMAVLFFIEWCKACNTKPSILIDSVAKLEHRNLGHINTPVEETEQ